MPVSRFSTEFRRQVAAISCGSVLALAAVGAQQPALTGAARWADTVRVTIEQANLRGTAADLAAAGALAERALTAFPNDGLLLHYRAYALYRQAQRGQPESDETMAMTTKAIELLERSHAVRPMAETQALLSACHGTLASTGMIAGMRHGPAANAARDAAAELAPNNPRVLLLAALASWFTPPMWGGGEDKGYALMQRAVASFATDRPARPLPAWGAAEAQAWLGQMEQKRGNPAAARAAYEKALAIEPGYLWVARVLLPTVAGKS
jgi:tetratricopeptide (TPR) repeat protein